MNESLSYTDEERMAIARQGMAHGLNSVYVEEILADPIIQSLCARVLAHNRPAEARVRILALTRYDLALEGEGMRPHDEGDYLDREQVLRVLDSAPPIADMVRLWRDLDRRISAEEITTAKAAELFVAEFGQAVSLPAPTLAQSDFLLLLRDFDPVKFAAELDAKSEQTERLVTALREAQKVSRELLNSEITI